MERGTAWRRRHHQQRHRPLTGAAAEVVPGLLRRPAVLGQLPDQLVDRQRPSTVYSGISVPGLAGTYEGPIFSIRLKTTRQAEQVIELLNQIAAQPGWSREKVRDALSAKYGSGTWDYGFSADGEQLYQLRADLMALLESLTAKTGDFDGDGQVDVVDLLYLVDSFGTLARRRDVRPCLRHSTMTAAWTSWTCWTWCTTSGRRLRKAASVSCSMDSAVASGSCLRPCCWPRPQSCLAWLDPASPDVRGRTGQRRRLLLTSAAALPPRQAGGSTTWGMLPDRLPARLATGDRPEVRPVGLSRPDRRAGRAASGQGEQQHDLRAGGRHDQHRLERGDRQCPRTVCGAVPAGDGQDAASRGMLPEPPDSEWTFHYSDFSTTSFGNFGTLVCYGYSTRARTAATQSAARYGCG